MRITIIVEGKTEKAFIPHLREYLKSRLRENMPRVHIHKYDGRVPKDEELRNKIANLLSSGSPDDFVIALTDVYTGTQPPDFNDAADAKNKMRQWVGNEPRFHPHAAQHDFEAWLLPYWDTIQRLAGHNITAPAGAPETVNHMKPPADRIKEIFRAGRKGKRYVKPRDANRILCKNDLSVAISQCPELKALINTIVVSCGGTPVP